jgi:hypothetical protein
MYGKPHQVESIPEDDSQPVIPSTKFVTETPWLSENGRQPSDKWTPVRVTQLELCSLRGPKFPCGTYRPSVDGVQVTRLTPEEVERLMENRKLSGTPSYPDPPTRKHKISPRKVFHVTDAELQVIRDRRQWSSHKNVVNGVSRTALLHTEYIERLTAYRGHNHTLVAPPPGNGSHTFRVTDLELRTIRGNKYKVSKSRSHKIGDLRTVHLTDKDALRLTELRSAKGHEERHMVRNHKIGDLRRVHLSEKEVLRLTELRSAKGHEGV